MASNMCLWGFLGLLGALMACQTSSSTLATSTLATSFDVVLTPQAVPLDASDPGRSEVGALRFLAGFHLTADRSEFGGLSGLECLGEDGLLAVSDRGHWLSMGLQLDDSGKLVAFKETRMGPLLDDDGQPVENRGRRDAEELAEVSGSEFLVTFEGDHRAVRYALEKQQLSGLPMSFETPPGIHQGEDNSGFEAITRLTDGRWMLMTEGMRDDADRLVGWLSSSPEGGAISEDSSGDSQAFEDLRLTATGPFQPTAADSLPSGPPYDGDVLLVQRHYTPETGTRVRLMRLDRETLRPDATATGEELAAFEAPLTVDNFEGLAVCPRAAGGPLIYLVSDDNFNPEHQRTLLLQFELLASTPSLAP